MISATARADKDLREVEKALDEEFDRFLQEGPTDKELARIKTQAYAGFVRGIERIGGFGGKSDILATNQTYLGNPHGYKQRLRNLEQATREGLEETARTWLSDGVYELEVTPFAAAKPLPPVDRTQAPETRDGA